MGWCGLDVRHMDAETGLGSLDVAVRGHARMTYADVCGMVQVGC